MQWWLFLYPHPGNFVKLACDCIDMNCKSIHLLILFLIISPGHLLRAQINNQPEFNIDSVVLKMQKVNAHFKANAWKQNDRNWIRGTYYTGLMAFYKVVPDSLVMQQLKAWGQKHGWKTGTEWIYPANRLTCSQTWLQLFEFDSNAFMIGNTKAFMDKRIRWDEPAFEAGWDYVDALYVGAPAYFMMSAISGDPKYAQYGHRIYQEVYAQLYDFRHHLFYRDLKAKNKTAEDDKPEFWSRGNGWAFAAIPKILNYLPESDTMRGFYIQLMKEMASSLITCQAKDGYWRSNLLDSQNFPDPESSGTAFFTYGLAWGINQNILNETTYKPALAIAWNALYHSVDKNGNVCCGQDVARAPGSVNKNNSREFVAGAFLLAGSEIIRMIR